MNGGGQVNGIGGINIIFSSNLSGNGGNLRCKVFDLNDRKIEKLVIGVNNRSGIFLEG